MSIAPDHAVGISLAGAHRNFIAELEVAASKLIGLIWADGKAYSKHYEPWVHEYQLGLNLVQAGHSIREVFLEGDSPETICREIAINRFDGLIWCAPGSNCNIRSIRKLRKEGLPVITLEENVADEIDSIEFDQIPAFADMGLCVISPNYGLSPRFKYPECVKHLFACFKWICDHAEERRLDLDNVLITGDSAGGQLACLVLAIQNNAEVKARIGAVDSPLRFKGGMLVCGAYDPDSMAKNIFSNKLFLEMTGYGRKHLREFKDYDLMNPVNFVDKDFPADVMVAYGRFDAFVGGNEKILFKRLNELGIPYREYRAKGAGEHCFHLWHYRRPISRKFFELARDYVADKVGYRYR